MWSSKPARQKIFHWTVFCALALATSAVLHFQSPNLPDSDSFYHFRHAAEYRVQGLGTADFPWLTSSVITSFKSDIWYGFHLLLIPFTLIQDEILGIKLAGVAITGLFLILTGIGFKILRLRYAFILPFAAIFAAPNALFHLAMTRPHVLTSSLALIVFALILSAKKPKPWLIGLTAFVSAFLHLSLFWLPILSAIIAIGARYFTERKLHWRELVGVILGLAIAWLLRPNPIGAAHLVYVQMFELLVAKFQGIPLLFGKELFPLDWGTFAKNFLPFTLVWIWTLYLAIEEWLRLKKANTEIDRQTLLLGTVIISVTYFLMTMFLARRFYDLWAVFGITLCGLILTKAKSINTRQNQQSGLATVCLITLLALIPYGLYTHARSLETANNPNEFKKVGLWLKQNTPPQTIIYNIYWDIFPKLFFWNPQGRYIRGMDPIFEYSFNPTQYWRGYYLNTGDTTNMTCPKTECTAADLEDTYEVLTKKFKANYIVVEKIRNAKFLVYALNDTRYHKVFESEGQVIFAL